MDGEEKREKNGGGWLSALLAVNLTVVWTGVRLLIAALFGNAPFGMPESVTDRFPDAPVWGRILLFLILYAGLAIGFSRGDVFLCKRVAQERAVPRHRFLLRTPGFYCGLAGAVFLVCVFPSACAVTALGSLFPSVGRWVFSVFVLLFCVLWEGAGVLLARRFRSRLRGKRAKKNPIWETLRFLLNLWCFLAALALLLLVMMPPLTEAISATWNADVLLLALQIVSVPVAVVLIVRFVRWMRARRKRKKFLRDLSRVCRENGFDVSSLEKGTRRLWRNVPFCFTLEARGVTYRCAVYACLRYRLPLYLFGDGTAAYRHAVKIRRVELFHWFVRFPCDVESAGEGEAEGKKLLIFNPVPATMFLSDGHRRYTADTGDRAGDCWIYSASGFLGALERNTLCRAPR